jgi:hypothetical protein
VKKSFIKLAAGCLAAVLLLSSAQVFAAGAGFANFVKTAEYTGQFTDVKDGAWYKSSVASAYELGLAKGESAALYGPGRNVTVAQAITLCDRIYSIYSGDGHDFGSAEPWYSPYVDYAVEHGFVKQGQFTDYNAAATRAQVAQLLAALPDEMLQQKNNIVDGVIPDVPSTAACAAAVYKLYRAGITCGSDEAGTYRPGANISRAETAAIIERIALPEKRISRDLTERSAVLYADDGRRISVPVSEANSYLALGWSRSPITVPAGSSAEKILNSASLTPMLTGNEQLDSIVSGIFAKIITPKMTTYQKVKACYDYLIKNTAYGSSGPLMIYGTDYQYLSDELRVQEALTVFTTGTGVCDDYASAFLVMTRRIGLQSYFTGGMTSKAGGGFTGHAWNIISVGGVDYVFDTQVEDNIANGGKIMYYRFCKTYAQVSANYKDYDTASSKADFGGFAKIPADA